ncbi:MAG: hypothetical protein H6R21_1646, partial [Proteobacteria bacterium]|nr:hypothetical protein [Pseudomonadota bacterium]
RKSDVEMVDEVIENILKQKQGK